MARSRQIDYEPSYEATVDRAERKGSMFDNLLKDAKIYKPRQGANLVRILPPSWPKAAHYGLTIFVHGSVGPNDRRYLCLRENQTSPHKRCPVCEELYRLGSKASQEDRQQLRAKPQVIYYIVDRDNEKDGVQVWMTSPTTDSEIAAQSVNRRAKSVVKIVDIDDGYDVEFTRTGTTRNNTRYRGFQILREPSPLAESNKVADEWLDVVFDKPLPSLLQFYSPEHIEEVFYGRAKEDEPQERVRARDSDADDGEERPTLRRTRVVDEDREESRPRRRSDTNEDDGAQDRPARRARGTDDEEGDERPARSARRPREERDERDDDARDRVRAPARAGTRHDADDDAPRRRSRLQEELDDEIPSSAGRRGASNGRDGESEERPSRARRPADEDEEEEPRRQARRRPTDDGGEDEAGEAAAREASRERVRSRLNRE